MTDCDVTVLAVCEHPDGGWMVILDDNRVVGVTPEAIADIAELLDNRREKSHP